MNFLAHLFLSRHDEELMVGNFIGDFVRNRDLVGYPAGVRRGVKLHRRIDSYTDNHELVRQGMRRLYPQHHKYAAVIIDVFYDFLLAHNWKYYSERPIREFTKSAYRILEKHQLLLPGFLQERLSLMIADDWLMHYTTMQGLEHTFQRMQRRVSRPEYFRRPTDSLQRDFESLNEEFNGFFPDVIRFVAGFDEVNG